MVKTCTKCGVEKDCSEFHKDKGKSMGVSSICKVCRCEYFKGWRKDNPDYDKNYQKKNRRKLTEYHLDYDKEYRKRNPEIGRMRSMVRDLSKRLNTTKSARTHEELGYSADELNRHLSAMKENWTRS